MCGPPGHRPGSAKLTLTIAELLRLRPKQLDGRDLFDSAPHAVNDQRSSRVLNQLDELIAPMGIGAWEDEQLDEQQLEAGTQQVAGENECNPTCALDFLGSGTHYERRMGLAGALMSMA